MLHNAYLLAKIGADTAKNERKFAAIFPKTGNYLAVDADTVANFVKISAKFRSFSAVSAPIFASKSAFCSIFQNLQDYLAENFEVGKILQILQHLQKKCYIFSEIVDFSNRFFAKKLRLQGC